MTDELFRPVRIGALALPSRIVMAPMTRNRAGEGNAPQPINAEYYRQRASAALIVTEGTQVSAQGVGYPATPGIHTEAQAAGWKTVTDAVHRADGRIFAQLWHVGRISHPSLQPDGALPVAPSAIRPEGEAFTYEGPKPFVEPRALDIEEIPGVVGQFAAGARYARDAGFDGVEIHAANGYLIDQFLRDGTNRRTDAYGGSLENRARFLREVTETVAAIWGADRVGVRLSPVSPFNAIEDSDPEAAFTYFARVLGEYDLAYLHVVEPGPDEPFFRAALKDAFGGPYMANGGYDREIAAAVLASGEADLVSFGASFLANPDLPARLRTGASLNEPDRATFYGGAEEGYVDYPPLAAAQAA